MTAFRKSRNDSLKYFTSSDYVKYSIFCSYAHSLNAQLAFCWLARNDSSNSPSYRAWLQLQKLQLNPRNFASEYQIGGGFKTIWILRSWVRNLGRR